MRDNIDNIHLLSLLLKKDIDDSMLIEFQDKLTWKKISKYQNLSKEFIKNNIENIDFILLSKNKKVEVEVLKQYKDRISVFELLIKEYERYKFSDLELFDFNIKILKIYNKVELKNIFKTFKINNKVYELYKNLKDNNINLKDKKYINKSFIKLENIMKKKSAFNILKSSKEKLKSLRKIKQERLKKRKNMLNKIIHVDLDVIF